MITRTDNRLRTAISNIEKLLFTNPSTEDVLHQSLQQMMALLDASYGYVYQCGDVVDIEIPWELSYCYEAKEGNLSKVVCTCTSSSIPRLYQAKLLAGKCITQTTFNEPLTPVPHTHPEISDFLCIPFIDAKRIYAVMYVCNTEGGFPQTVETRIRPFLAAANCLLRTAVQKNDHKKNTPLAEASIFNTTLMNGLMSNMFNSVFVVNDSGTITLCNNAAADLFGLPVREIIGEPLARFLPKGLPTVDTRIIENTGNEGVDSGNHAERMVWRGVPALNTHGKKFLVDLSSFAIHDHGSVLKCLVIDDISERIKSSADYHHSLQRFQVLTNLAPIAIIQLNRHWECTYVNDTWCEYCHITPDEASGVGWLRNLHSHEADQVLNALREDTSLTGKYEGQFRLQTPLGKTIWVNANACSLFTEDGDTTGIIMTLSDITTQKNHEHYLKEIAEKDQLTGLTNRAFFTDRLQLALNGVSRFGSVVLMFLDLDKFKQINDTLGHGAGDELLKDVASRLQEVIRQVDTIARIGGDEFTILMTNVQNTNSITAVADKICSALSTPFTLGDRTIYVTCSIGIAVAEADSAALTTTEIFKQADDALYKAKDNGRNQYRFYTSELDESANLHILLRQSLKESARKDFRVVYQPQVDARTGQLIGMEALSRWSRDDISPTPASVFIKMIEESGLITDFSEWLLEDVFSTMNKWKQLGFSFAPLTMSINISAKQLRDRNLASYIHQRCIMHGIDPAAIVLEVTETALIDDPETATEILKKLQRIGFSISLDDFGTGYSSLLHLRKMPLKSVKIDRSFVKDVLHDADDAKIVTAIIALAETLELKVIAEGVDNTDVKQWLIENQCPYHQGFYYHKPLELADIESLLKVQSRDNKVLSFKGLVR